MDSPTLLPEVVQAIRDSVMPILAGHHSRAQSLESFLNGIDVSLLHSAVEGARQALHEVVTQEDVPKPNPSAKLMTYSVHTTIGVLSMKLWNMSPDGEGDRHLDSMQLLHGCTLGVREQCAFLIAQGTAQEARDAMQLFRSSVPSESTIKRVSATDGLRMMEVWDTHVPELVETRFGALLDDVDLVSTSADGAFVPLRGTGVAEGSSADGGPDDTAEAVDARAYREARIITVTLYGKPDDSKERFLTVHNDDGIPRGECVGFQRPRLGTLIFGEMPSVDGPKGKRASTALGEILAAIWVARPDVTFKGTTDGGSWPEQTIDEAVGEENRNSDFYHATEHLREGSKAAFGDTELSTAWYKRWRTALLTIDGAAENLSAEFSALAKVPGRREADTKALKREAGYFRKRAEHMQYADLLRNDMIIGSGLVEAAVKRLISLRMKRTGATWSELGGDAVITLRSLRLSGLWNHAWRIHEQNERSSYAA